MIKTSNRDEKYGCERKKAEVEESQRENGRTEEFLQQRTFSNLVCPMKAGHGTEFLCSLDDLVLKGYPLSHLIQSNAE